MRVKVALNPGRPTAPSSGKEAFRASRFVRAGMPGFLCSLSPQAGRGKAAWLSLNLAPMRVSPTVAPTSSLRRLPVASAPHMQEVRGDEARHSLIDIRSRADNADIAEFRLRLAREMAQHPCPHIRSRIRNIDAFHYGDARGIDHGVPSRCNRDVSSGEAGLLGELAHDVAKEVDGFAAHVVGIGRAGR